MTRLTSRIGAARAAILLLIASLCALAAPAVANAGIGAGASVQLLPNTVHVGDHGTGTVRLANSNYNTSGAPADAQLTNTVCNAGMACPSSTAIDTQGISVVPACAKLTASTTCVAGYEDPGVFALAATATGEPGSSCSGTQFTVTRATGDSPDLGRYVFAPVDGGRVTLTGAGAACTINFTYTVVKLPKDADPATAGYETITLTHHTQFSPAISAVVNANGLGSSQNQTVLPPPPVVVPPPAPPVTPQPVPVVTPPVVVAPPAPQRVVPVPTAVACTPAPGPAPQGGSLCQRGSSTVTGKTGCVGTPFDVTVRGSEIVRVTFSVDGTAVRMLTRPNKGTRYVQRINPRTMRVGVHRVTARVVFTKQSGTRARTQRVTFSRCQKRQPKPMFTG